VSGESVQYYARSMCVAPEEIRQDLLYYVELVIGEERVGVEERLHVATLGFCEASDLLASGDQPELMPEIKMGPPGFLLQEGTQWRFARTRRSDNEKRRCAICRGHGANNSRKPLKYKKILHLRETLALYPIEMLRFFLLASLR